jgi:hypothetical protein
MWGRFATLGYGNAGDQYVGAGCSEFGCESGGGYGGRGIPGVVAVGGWYLVGNFFGVSHDVGGEGGGECAAVGGFGAGVVDVERGDVGRGDGGWRVDYGVCVLQSARGDAAGVESDAKWVGRG